jgi:hypothetical protein
MFNQNNLSIVLLLLILVGLIYLLVVKNTPTQESFDENIVHPKRYEEAMKAEKKQEQKDEDEQEEEQEDEKVVPQVMAVNDNDIEGRVDGDFADLDDAYGPLQNDGLTADTVNLLNKEVKQFKAEDYLPKEKNDDWFDTDFAGSLNIENASLINTEKYQIGVNTVGQSLKNPSYDIRGTIPNPKFNVGPFNNSTYEPDFNIKSLY